MALSWMKSSIFLTRAIFRNSHLRRFLGFFSGGYESGSGQSFTAGSAPLREESEENMTTDGHKIEIHKVCLSNYFCFCFFVRECGHLFREWFCFAENILVDDELPEGVLEHLLPGVLLQPAVGAQAIQADGRGTVHRSGHGTDDAL